MAAPYTIVFAVTVAGTVHTFDRDGYSASLATALGVAASDIVLTVTAASVKVVARIDVASAGSMDRMLAVLEPLQADVSAASALLNVQVESVEPVATETALPPADASAGIGIAAATVFLIAIGVIIYIVRMRRRLEAAAKAAKAQADEASTALPSPKALPSPSPLPVRSPPAPAPAPPKPKPLGRKARERLAREEASAQRLQAGWRGLLGRVQAQRAREEKINSLLDLDDNTLSSSRRMQMGWGSLLTQLGFSPGGSPSPSTRSFGSLSNRPGTFDEARLGATEPENETERSMRFATSESPGRQFSPKSSPKSAPAKFDMKEFAAKAAADLEASTDDPKPTPVRLSDNEFERRMEMLSTTKSGKLSPPPQAGSSQKKLMPRRSKEASMLGAGAIGSPGADADLEV